MNERMNEQMATMQPLVSIVIPVYKIERFLSDCVNSVLGQSYQALEILLVDDGSPDGCPALCDGFAETDARVRVIHQQNGGLSRARNAGLAAACGKYVYFLDSDDYLAAEAIERLVVRAEETDADIVFFESLLVSEDCSEHPQQNAHRRAHRYDTPMRGAEMLSALVQNDEFMTPVPYLFLRRDFMQSRRFEPDLVYEDVLFSFLAFLDAACVVGLTEPLYRYRIRGGSIMTGGASLRHFHSLLFVYRAIEARLSSADTAARDAIIRELSTLLQAELHLYYRLSFRDRRTVQSAHQDFLKEAIGSTYAEEQPALFAIHPLRIHVTQIVHRLLSDELRAKIRRFLHL